MEFLIVKKIKKNSKELVNFDLASLIRLKENLDLPKNSTLGKKSSDVFGKLEFNPNDKFKFSYNFALDNNLDKSNYDSFSTKISLNKLVTTFEYFDEKKNLINESFTSNSTSYEIDEKNYYNNVWLARALSDNDLEKSKTLLEQSLELSPSSEEAYKEILRIYLDLDKNFFL